MQRALLPPQVLRSLGDRSYEKRKAAAVQIEARIRELIKAATNPTGAASTPTADSASIVTAGGVEGATSAPQVRSASGDPRDDIRAIIDLLVSEFAHSTQSNYRKGGLIGIAAASIALMDETPQFLPYLLPPVLKCFQDQEPRVRYYACESLYNISKVARGSVLIYFNEVFDGLCRLFSDVEADVKNGAQLLDRLLKDIVTESEAFDVEKFIPLLRERISITDPMIRTLLVGWITVLDSVPDIDMLEYLPEFLGGLFEMLSDPNKDIRQQAYAALAEFLRAISQSIHVELGAMIPILMTQCSSKDNFTRLTALSWLHEFIQLGKFRLLPFAAQILSVCLQCTADAEAEIRTKAEATNAVLLQLVGDANEQVEVPPLLNKLTAQIRSKWVSTRLASLRWVSMLLAKMPDTMFENLHELFPALLDALSDPDEKVVRHDLKVLAAIASHESNFNTVLQNLLNVFSSNRKLLEMRGSLIIRQFCVLLDGESIFRAFGRILAEETDDIEFASLMVQTLHLILLTSAELLELRQLIMTSPTSAEGADLFHALFKPWCRNPVSTFALCLLAQSYELASAIVFRMAETDATVGFLMQIDKLVQLIESPIFVHLRLQLLEPKKHPFLFKSLYGLLMLLPQSSSFVALKTRLESVQGLAMFNVPDCRWDDKSGSAAASSGGGAKNAKVEGELLQTFAEVQASHVALRKEIYKQHRLAASAPQPVRRVD